MADNTDKKKTNKKQATNSWTSMYLRPVERKDSEDGIFTRLFGKRTRSTEEGSASGKDKEKKTTQSQSPWTSMFLDNRKK